MTGVADELFQAEYPWVHRRISLSVLWGQRKRAHKKFPVKRTII